MWLEGCGSTVQRTVYCAHGGFSEKATFEPAIGRLVGFLVAHCRGDCFLSEVELPEKLFGLVEVGRHGFWGKCWVCHLLGR